MTKVQSKDAFLFDLTNDTGTLRDGLVATIGEGTTTEPGLLSAMDKTKLDGIAADATANATDAALRDRASHTGEQALGTITGLIDALAGKATPADVAAALAGLVDSSPATLDTLNELAAALGDDPNFATTVSTALGNRVRVDGAQGLTAPQQAQGRDNLGLGSAALAAAAEFATAAQGAKADTALQDPLREMAADGATLDSAKFDALRADLPGLVIDLCEGDYAVTDVPAGPAVNGTWVVPGAGEGGGTVRLDALKLRREPSRLLFSGAQHYNWPQGKNGLRYNGSIFFIVMEGSGHEASDMHVRIVRSPDNGSSWPTRDRILQAAGQARSCWAATIVHGRLFLVARIHSGAHNDAAIVGATIYSTRLYERRERKNNPVTGVDASNMFLQVWNGEPRVRVGACPEHGVLVGSIINITNAAGPISGLNVSGDKTVTAVGPDWFEFQPGGNATANATTTPDFTIRFREESSLVEHLFGGDTIYTEVTTFPGTTRTGANPFYFHGAAPVLGDASGAMYVGVTGGTVGPSIIKVTGLIYGTPTLAKMTTITTDHERGEPAFATASDGTVMGFLRTNEPDKYGGLFWSDDDIDSFTLRLNFSGTANDFRYAPFGVDIDRETDTLYAVTTGNRVRGTAGTMQAGEVPAYMFTGSVADVKINGVAAVKIKEYRKLWFANESQGDTGNGVGVGACVYNEGVVHIAMATETANYRSDAFGSPNIVYDRLPTVELRIEQAGSRQVASIDDGERDVMHAGRFRGLGAAEIIGHVTSVGVVDWSDSSFTVFAAVGRAFRSYDSRKTLGTSAGSR